MKRFERLEVVSDKEGLSRRSLQLRMARNHFAHQERVRMEVYLRTEHRRLPLLFFHLK
jgi:hypothetical protein